MGKELPKISVLISTYNRTQFLTRCLGSVLSQTFPDFELVLVNNGSTDETQKLCEEYAQKDNRIKLVSLPENHGAPQGRNVGIDVAACEYITIVDDDDLCEPEMLEYLWNLVSKYKADIAMCGSWNDFGDHLEPYFIYDNLLLLDRTGGLDELLKREKYNVAPPTKLFRKKLFDGIRFPGGVLVDDIHVIYKVFANANIVVGQGKPLYKFTKHGKNMTEFIQSNRLSPNLLDEYLLMYRTRTQYLIKKAPNIETRAKYSEWSYMISMCNKIKTYHCDNCKKQYDFMIQQMKDNYNEFVNSPFITDKEKQLVKEHIG